MSLPFSSTDLVFAMALVLAMAAVGLMLWLFARAQARGGRTAAASERVAARRAADAPVASASAQRT